MKNVTLFFVAIVMLFASNTATAQIYFKGGASYGFSFNNEVIGSTTTNSFVSEAYTTENKYGTSGSGVTATLGAGFMLNEHFGVELKADYLFGSKVTTSSLTTDESNTNITKNSSRQFALSPTLVFMTGEGIAPYARVGAYIPLAGSTITTNDVDYGSTTVDAKAVTKGQFTVGINTAIGVNIPISEKLGVYVEAGYVGLNLKAKSTEVTEYSRTDIIFGNTINTELADLPVGSVQTTYVDVLTAASNNSENSSYDSALPSDVLATTRSSNRLNINIGVKFKL